MGVTPDNWTFISGNDNDGIENPSTDGEVCVAIGSDDGIYQTFDYFIQANETYRLTFDVRYLWSGGAYNCTFTGKLYYFDNGSRNLLSYIQDTYSEGMPDWSWHENYTVSVNVPAESDAVGKQLGVEFTTDQAAGSWFGFDNIRLQKNVVRTQPSIFYIDSDTGDDANSGMSEDQAWESLVPVNGFGIYPGR